MQCKFSELKNRKENDDTLKLQFGVQLLELADVLYWLGTRRDLEHGSELPYIIDDVWSRAVPFHLF
jgi:hypothetical protein